MERDATRSGAPCPFCSCSRGHDVTGYALVDMRWVKVGRHERISDRPNRNGSDNYKSHCNRLRWFRKWLYPVVRRITRHDDHCAAVVEGGLRWPCDMHPGRHAPGTPLPPLYNHQPFQLDWNTFLLLSHIFASSIPHSSPGSQITTQPITQRVQRAASTERPPLRLIHAFAAPAAPAASRGCARRCRPKSLQCSTKSSDAPRQPYAAPRSSSSSSSGYGGCTRVTAASWALCGVASRAVGPQAPRTTALGGDVCWPSSSRGGVDHDG